MKIGTAETITEAGDPPKLKKRSSGIGQNPPGGGSGGNNGGGGDGPRPDPIRAGESNPDKAKVVTWFLLLVVLMTFGGLIGAYVVLATNRAAEWDPFALPIPVWVSTVLIGISSLTYHAAKKAVDREKWERSRKWFIATTAIAVAFIVSQMIAWAELYSRGLYMSGNPFAGLFYILTGIHAVHVLGGMIALGVILLRAWLDTENAREIIYRQRLARSVGWYWHFMGVLWLVLFLMLGFWR